MKKSFLVAVATFSLIGTTTVMAQQSIQYKGPYSWKQDTGAVVMTPVSSSVCFLTKVSGHFAGDGELVQVTTQGTNWVLTGASHQGGVNAEAMCIVGVTPSK